MPDHVIVIYKKKNQVVNTLSLLRLLRRLKGDCMYRVTFENLNEPMVMFATYKNDLKATIVTPE